MEPTHLLVRCHLSLYHQGKIGTLLHDPDMQVFIMVIHHVLITLINHGNKRH